MKLQKESQSEERLKGTGGFWPRKENVWAIMSFSSYDSPGSDGIILMAAVYGADHHTATGESFWGFFQARNDLIKNAKSSLSRKVERHARASNSRPTSLTTFILKTINPLFGN